MSSLIKRYFEEIENKKIIENQHGFLIYKQIETGFLIDILYVDPRFRELGAGSALFELFKQENPNAKNVHCIIDLNNNYAEVSLQAIMSAGFKPTSADKNYIYLTKELS